MKEEESKVNTQGKTNLNEYFDELMSLNSYEGLVHSYEVKVEQALYSEEKYSLYDHYFKTVHNDHN